MPPITIDLDDEATGQLDAICARFEISRTAFLTRCLRRLSADIAERDRTRPKPDLSSEEDRAVAPWAWWRRRG